VAPEDGVFVAEIEGAVVGLALRRLTVRPVGRNDAALRFFHGAGFDVLGRIELQLALRAERIDRKPGPELAGRRFRV